VSGGLLSSLTFQNTSVLNDYFQAFTFGSKLSFEITLDGPALESPDGTSTSGSTFAFSIFSNQAGTTPALTSDTVNGFGLLVNVNLDSTTTVINNLISGTVTQPLLKTTTSLTASPAGPYVVGETVTIEVSVTAASGSSHPTGTVTLVSPQESVTVALSSSGVLKKTALLNIPAGTYHLYAVYNGDADFKPSTSATVTAIVSKK